MMITMIEAALLLLGVWLWFRGDFTVGSFVVIVSYIGLLWGYLFDIGQQVKNYLRAAAHAQEMIVDIPEMVAVGRGNERQIAAVEAAEDFTIRREGAPEDHQFVVDPEELPEHVPGGVRQQFRLQFIHPRLDLI